jgi:hypothetical protein
LFSCCLVSKLSAGELKGRREHKWKVVLSDEIRKEARGRKFKSEIAKAWAHRAHTLSS